MTQLLSLWKGGVSRPTNPAEIVREVASRHGLTRAELESTSRSRHLAWPRQEAMWELRQRTSLSLPRIGMYFGNRDHTTVLHGIRAHAARMCGESVD